MAEIADELLKYDLDITALQEIRWKGYGRIKKPRYTLLYSGAEKQGEQGVGFLIKRSRFLMHMFLACMYLRNVCDNDCMSVSLTATVYLDY